APAEFDSVGGEIEPAHLAIFTDNLEFIARRQWYFARLALPAALLHHLTHVGVGDFPEVHLQQLLAGVAGKGLASRIHIDEPVVLVDGDGGSRSFRHCSKLGFTFTRGLLGLPPRGEIVYDAEKALASLIVDHAGIGFYLE